MRQPWIDKILRGEKTWELRGSRTRIRGPIALIQSGTGTVVGTCELVEVHGPLSLAELRRTTARHRVPVTRFRDGLPYRQTYAWQLRGARRLRRSVPYRHPAGAVIWVNLDPGVASAIGRMAPAGSRDRSLLSSEKARRLAEEWGRRLGSRSGSDSVELIREDRDSR